MSIQLSRANSGTPLTPSDYNSDNLIVETAVNSLLGSSSSGGTVTNLTEVDTDTASEIFSASISNPSTTPEITFTRISKAGNLVYASPNGTSGKPTMRALVAADLPIVPFDKGGTGTTDAMTNNKVLSQRLGVIKYTGITGASTGRIAVTPTTDNFEIDIVPAQIELNSLATTTALSISKGGTGHTTAQEALDALTSVTGAVVGYVLTKVGSAVAWAAQSVGIVTLNGLTGTSVTIGADNITAGVLNKWNATHSGDVSGSDILTIGANKVTYDKMQAVSAEKKILGRITTGAGTVEEIGISGNLTMDSTSLIVRTSKVKTATASYQVLATDGTILIANTGGLVMTLPDITSGLVKVGDIFVFKNIGASTNNSIYVNNIGTDRIDGETHIVLLQAYDTCTLMYGDGGTNNWYILSRI